MEDATLTIYNSIGQTIHRQAVDKSTYQQLLINVKDDKDGIYFIRSPRLHSPINLHISTRHIRRFIAQ